MPTARAEMSDTYTIEMRMCDDSGMVSHEYVESKDRSADESFKSGETYLDRHIRLMKMTKQGREYLKAHPDIGEKPWGCTGRAHYAGEYIRCTSPAHQKIVPQTVFPNLTSFNRQIYENPRVMTENKFGGWVPAIPQPYFGIIRFKCPCGAKFWNIESYEGHYALRHILKPE